MNKGRKITGGKYHAHRKKKHHEKKGQEKTVFLGETKVKQVRGRGKNHRTVLLKGDTANLVVKGKVSHVEIKNVVETPQNKFLARQNRLMKGVIVETTEGKARITNRPTRDGFINAVLIE